MKFILPLIFLGILISTTSFAQTQSPIEVGRTFWLMKFKHEGKVVPFKKVNRIIIDGKHQTLEPLEKASSMLFLSQFVGFIGGGFIGYGLADHLTKGEANWTLVAIGGGVLLGSIPITRSYKDNAQKAVEMYNAGISGQETGSLRFGLSPNGIGFVFRH